MKHPRWMHYHDAWRYDSSMHLSLEIDPDGLAILLGGYASIGQRAVARRLADDGVLHTELAEAMKRERADAMVRG